MGEVMVGGTLDRRAVVSRLLEGRKDLLVVTGLGSAAYDVMAAGDHDNNYYLWAAMGSAAMVGLGVASAQPDRQVVVVTGDGEAMMGFGALATIAVQKLKNLAIVILDNGHFGETGMQLSHSGLGVRIDRAAAGLGFDWTAEITDMDGVGELQRHLRNRDGLKLAVVKIVADDKLPRVLPPRDGVHIKNRFRAALGFAPI